MSADSKIEWTDATWSPTLGCTRVSPGCDNCYAIRTVHRMSFNPNPKVSGPASGLTAWPPSPGQLDWTGHVRTLPDRLDLPLRWRKPRRIFVDSQSDLFHDDVPDEFIARVWAVMAVTPRHTYQVLTKRHGRMRSLLSSDGFTDMVHRFAPALARVAVSRAEGDGAAEWAARVVEQDRPLRNAWLGVSVEDQKRADLRIPALLDTPAAVRFLSCEPLLGAVDLGDIQPSRLGREIVDALLGERWQRGVIGQTPVDIPGVDWVIVGGDQCVAANVPFFLKQHGEHRLAADVHPDVRERHREHFDGQDYYVRVGKKTAGRELDGRTWDDFPERDVVPA